MKLEELEIIRKKIEKEYYQNEEKIKELEEKLKILDLNVFETRFSHVMAFSVIPLFCSLYLFCLFISKVISIPVQVLSGLFVGIPILMGVGFERLFMKSFKGVANIGSKKQRVIKEDIIRCGIELKKLLNENEVLKNIYSEIDSEKLLGRDAIEENNDIDSICLLEKSFDNKKKELNQKEKELDVLIKRCFLVSEFSKTINSCKNIYGDVILGSTAIMMLLNLPTVLIGSFGTSVGRFETIFGLLSSFLGSSAIIVLYNIKRNRDYKYAFDKINMELGDNAISDLKDYTQILEWSQRKKKVLNEIFTLKLELEKEKRRLETKTVIDKNNKEKSSSFSYCCIQKTPR